MMNIELLPHNEVAYKKLIECLKSNQFASINHATGTGKSFIILKYLYENRDKRILYLSPTYQINDQIVENHMSELGISLSDFSKFDFRIYNSLIKKTRNGKTTPSINVKELASQYDIIILDEYHRCGAKTWGAVVDDLLDELKKNHPEKRVVGLTATEIRYLDNNRNMNEHLFAGVEASRLTLADAIIDGILPAPVYVNYGFDILEKLNELEKRIDNYCFFSDDSKIYLERIANLRKQILNQIKQSDFADEYIKNCKKYLVFSQSIDNKAEDEIIIDNIIHNIDEKYYVHSIYGKKNNKEELKKFSLSPKDKTSVLFSINLLNEGVHVKNVDAICMLRQTSSPRIYFQQLGRLLSFSRRNDSVVILDLVNNIKNHHVIYELYQEVIDKINKIYDQYPENRERYDRVLKNFCIVDKSSSISKEYTELVSQINRSNLILNELNLSVNILENPTNYNQIERIQAQTSIIKYERYITLELYDRLNNISDIVLPRICKLNRDEFIKIKNDSNSKTYITNDSFKYWLKELETFVKENGFFPSLDSKDYNEVKLAKFAINNMYAFSKKTINFIKKNLTDNLSESEKNFYSNFVINDADIDAILNRNKNNKNEKSNNINNEMLFSKLFSVVMKSVDEELKHISIDKYIDNLFFEIKKYMVLKRININNCYNSSNVEAKTLLCKKIFLNEYFEEKGYNAEIEKLAVDIKMEDQRIKFKKLLVFMENHNGLLPSRNNSLIEENLIIFYHSYINKMSEEEASSLAKIKSKFHNYHVQLINDYLEHIEKYGYEPRRDVEGKNNALMDDFNRLLDNLSLDEENQLKMQVIESKTKYMFNNICKFMLTHDGALPSSGNRDFFEQELANLYRSFSKYLTDDQKNEIQDIQNKFPTEKIKVVNEYIAFIHKNNRIPFYDNCPEEEIIINERLNRWLPYLDVANLKRIKMLRSKINKYAQFQAAYDEIQKRKKV